MRRNCNLELGLFPPYDSGSPKQEERQSQPRQITIFYDGKICVSDVTELQMGIHQHEPYGLLNKAYRVMPINNVYS
ncbi:hypothetical protein Ahy_A10g051323 [Arachis hypogaea]|uniref:Tify domain-containing protein n=1 Tax=Arachis hypogaea TaxID=3818 RepID=A0A445BCI2_ARAHY|nr:hypothetical protein Ahy_A10g051323 [Arachis hypogaea]